MTAETILIVEDEPAISDLIETQMELSGYRCLTARDVPTAHQLVVNERPDLILLDWMLSGHKSGLDFCRTLKRDEMLSEIPVIMLTARGEEDSKVAGLDAGADDYITKPFSTRELSSRVKAVLRRTSVLSGDKVLSAGRLTLDPRSHRVSVDDQAVEMGPTEYKLLMFFMSHQDRAYTRSQILDQVWGGNVYIEDRTIDVHIRRLRKALEPFGKDQMVQTVRGTGYRFSTQGE